MLCPPEYPKCCDYFPEPYIARGVVLFLSKMRGSVLEAPSFPTLRKPPCPDSVGTSLGGCPSLDKAPLLLSLH